MSELTFPRLQAVTRRFTLGAPRNVSVAADGSRVAYLASRSGTDPVNCLWVVDVASEVDEPRLVVDPADTGVDGSDLPAAERARRERAREAGEGIVSYATDADFGVASFSLGGQVLLADLGSGDVVELPARPGAFDPRPGPGGARVAYVHDREVRVVGRSGEDRLLVGEDDPDISWGAAEFVAAEEMGRNRGFWWAPDGGSLLVARVDVRSVPVWYLADPTVPDRVPRPIRYPHAGATNADVTLHLVDATSGDHKAIEWDRDRWEYLADVIWTGSAAPTLVVQSRDQRQLAVLTADTDSGRTEMARLVQDPVWVELVPGSPLWCDGRLVTVEDRHGWRRLCRDGVPLTPDGLQVRSVAGEGDGEDVWVMASAEPATQALYRVPLDGRSCEPLRTDALATGPAVATASAAAGTVAVRQATMARAGAPLVILRDGEAVATVVDRSVDPGLEPNVRFFEAPGPVSGALLMPRQPADGPLPVLMDPYGGPHAQRVVHRQSAFWASQWLADQGFAVVVADGRGTPGRGADYERAVAGDLATPVLEDQISALDTVAELEPRLDLDRVGIRGWSFGGFLAALAVLRRPDRFHAAVAGAPVTDWSLYDTHYTERYLGHPAADPDAYRISSLISDAAGLERPLLLIHGLADDNVVAAHTLTLSSALLESGRLHQVLPLPGVSHMTPQEVVAENLLLVQVAFLRESLGLAEFRR